MLRLLTVPLLLLSSLAAQQVSTSAFVQSSLGGAFGNSVPFGCLTSGLFVEGRSQILIPAQYLPSPNSLLTGIAVHSQTSSAGSGTLVYPLLKITISRNTNSSLGATFANNLPSPVVVLNATNLPVTWVANAWTTIPFSIPYLHDGASGLVIDIQKVVNPTLDLNSRTIQNAGRTDLPRMINALGGAGSGAHAAATATVTSNYPLSMQLRWAASSQRVIPTLKLLSDGASPFANQFAIGRTIAHTVQAAAGATVIHLAGPGLHLRAAPSPLLDGVIWVDTPFTLGQSTIPASGEATMTIPIPSSASLVGLYLTFQSVAVEAAAPPWRVTNAVDCFIRA